MTRKQLVIVLTSLSCLILICHFWAPTVKATDFALPIWDKGVLLHREVPETYPKEPAVSSTVTGLDKESLEAEGPTFEIPSTSTGVDILTGHFLPANSRAQLPAGTQDSSSLFLRLALWGALGGLFLVLSGKSGKSG